MADAIVSECPLCVGYLILFYHLARLSDRIATPSTRPSKRVRHLVCYMSSFIFTLSASSFISFLQEVFGILHKKGPVHCKTSSTSRGRCSGCHMIGMSSASSLRCFACHIIVYCMNFLRGLFLKLTWSWPSLEVIYFMIKHFPIEHSEPSCNAESWSAIMIMYSF